MKPRSNLPTNLPKSRVRGVVGVRVFSAMLGILISGSQFKCYDSKEPSNFSSSVNLVR
jgi:hypothetical protein